MAARNAKASAAWKNEWMCRCTHSAGKRNAPMNPVFRGRKLLDRGCSRTTMRAQRFKFCRFLDDQCKTRHRQRNGQRHPSYRLRCNVAAHVAHLAVLLVRRMAVPMPHGLHGKQAHAKNQGRSQPSRCDARLHLKFSDLQDVSLPRHQFVQHRVYKKSQNESRD